MRCRRHRDYIGKGMPTGDCRSCWAIYSLEHRDDAEASQWKHTDPIVLDDGTVLITELMERFDNGRV